jgi:hypothetical protein
MDTRHKAQYPGPKAKYIRAETTSNSACFLRGGPTFTMVLSLWSLVCGLFFAGCAQQQQYETVEQICPAGIDKQQAMQIAEEVLGKLHFSIAKSCPELGVIRTRPLTGAQFFEFWRKDNVGSFNFNEANLHTIRRIAELDIKQQDTQLCIRCNVNTQRLRLPEREIRSSSQAYNMFSQSSPSRQTLILHEEQKQGMAWVDLGQDKQLATVILKRIEKKITKIQKGKSL